MMLQRLLDGVEIVLNEESRSLRVVSETELNGSISVDENSPPSIYGFGKQGTIIVRLSALAWEISAGRKSE